MDRDHVVAFLDSEIQRLTQARDLLVSGRAANVGNVRQGKRGRKRHVMSAAGRKKISQMMKKRWAARRKTTAKKGR